MATTADRAQRVASIALGLAALGVASALAFVPVKGSARRPAARRMKALLRGSTAAMPGVASPCGRTATQSPTAGRAAGS